MSDVGLTIVRALPVTSGMLVNSSVSENDYPEYSATNSYAVGERVIVATAHRIYESKIVNNVGNNPVADTAQEFWLDVSATMRWRAFDYSHASKVSSPYSITYQLLPGVAITAFSARELEDCSTIQVRQVDPVYGEVYNQTATLTGVPVSSDYWTWCFGERFAPTQITLTDLQPYPAASLYITITGGSGLSLGEIVLGPQQYIGGVRWAPEVEFIDYSVKTVDDFGTAKFRERLAADEVSMELLVDAGAVDSVHTYMKSIRASFCLFIGPQYEVLNIFGWVGKYRTRISYPTHSETSLQVRSLT